MRHRHKTLFSLECPFCLLQVNRASDMLDTGKRAQELIARIHEADVHEEIEAAPDRCYGLR